MRWMFGSKLRSKRKMRLIVRNYVMQERAGVKMVMIQDGPQNTGADKPLRISGDPFKVQVNLCFLSFRVKFSYYNFVKGVFILI